MSSIIGIFTGEIGENSFATSAAGLPLNGTVQINGNTDLESTIKFNGGGCVHSITLTGSPGIYESPLKR